MWHASAQRGHAGVCTETMSSIVGGQFLAQDHAWQVLMSAIVIRSRTSAEGLWTVVAIGSTTMSSCDAEHVSKKEPR